MTLCYRVSCLEIEVVDDGATHPPPAAHAGHGIVGLQERITLLGGELEVGPRAGGGFRVAARLPVGGAA